jgi:CheY-like chemotaxis protein
MLPPELLVVMRILVLSTDPELALLRQHVLRNAGHETLALSSDKEIEQGFEKLETNFDVALLCHRVPDGRARELIRRFLRTNPSARIVAMVHLYGEWPQIEADRYVVGTDGPEALIRVMTDIAAERAAGASSGT